MPKVSVIVPIFGVEDYIERCARSLFEQTLDDIEFIFVNDATQDSSMSVLKSVIDIYPNRKGQIKIINHQENKGLPTARHTGLMAASGEYIAHCDSDDFVESEMYEMMYKKAIEEKYDIVVCDYYEGNENGWCKKKGIYDSSKDLLYDCLISMKMCVWNKLISRSVALNPAIVVPHENMGEDLALSAQHILLAKRYSYISKPLYHYCRRDESILGEREHSKLLQKQLQLINNFDIALEAVKRHGLIEKYKGAIIHECLYIKNQLLPIMRHQNCTRLWRGTYKEINRKVLFSDAVSKREKLNFVVTWLGLYPLYIKIKSR